jgi:hypothetical protein
VNRTAFAGLAVAPLLLLAACGGDKPAAAPAAQTATEVEAPPVDTEALKAHTQQLLDRWGCQPLEEPLSTNGAPGAFPGAPYVNVTCKTSKTTSDGLGEFATLTVFTSPEAKDANVAYSTSQIGGTVCLGDDWTLSDAHPLSRWVQVTGCKVR